MALGLILDVVLISLLAVTVLYCRRLERRLTSLRTGQDGLKDLVAALDRATDKAQSSLGTLQSIAATTASELKSERQEAGQLLDELKLMVSAADRVANRLAESRPPMKVIEQHLSATSPKETPATDIYRALRQAR